MSKKLRVALNGYGRVGKIFHRISLERDDIDVVAINSRGSVESHAHLFKYDSVYGTHPLTATCTDENTMKLNGTEVRVFINKDPGEINWSGLDVDVLVEATGKFKDRESCEKHLATGVKKIAISAPGKDEDVSIVMGINEQNYIPEKHNIVSNASCTTNALAHLMKVLLEQFGVSGCFLTTIHSVTKSQNILDGSHKKNLRIARAAYESMIPSSTGASKAITKLFPELEGNIKAKSIRVPLATVSALDLCVHTKKEIDVKIVNNAFKKYSEENAKYVGYTTAPLVSADYEGEKRTVVIDSLLTEVTNENMLNLFAWYDNEWGYTERLADLVELVGKPI